MYKLFYDDTKEEIYQIDPEGKKTVLADSFPSKPEYSPDKRKAIYISPLEWECPGSLYLYDLENGHISELVTPDENQNIPKYAIWLDNKTIALIIGFGAGTTQIGGNVYTINTNEIELKQVTNYSREIQITKLELKHNSLELMGIKYNDDTFNEFVAFNDKIPLDKIN
ncbi:hypothetical protein AF332_20100 [Sporosarcina globispora]|uniref:DUF4652 domain-containing protein n=1 Tax=Sporosarcina globispora TaxID=1459 RepID=A0A0M0GGF7_SPOGL|nr:DUF4652 domain-containing protein [Sporosarcina globispora]KON88873.1 hypothetical protein AF332_20100 [Sporosarcina globispora]